MRREVRDRLKSNVSKREDGLKRKHGEAGDGKRVRVWKFGVRRRFLAVMRRVEGMGEERARVESEGEDVTPTAVAKEVIGLRPCARYPNRGRRREPTGHPAKGRRREGLSVDEGGDDWRRPSDAAPLPRAPPIREGVSRPFAGAPLLSSPRGDRARGGAAPDPFEIRVSYRAIGRTSLALSRPFGERERASVFAPATLRHRAKIRRDEFASKLQ